MASDDITSLLQRVSDGDHACIGEVFARLYPELKRIARAQTSGGQRTLSPTALVHELYLRMADRESLSLGGRRHFFACAAKAMRDIVVDHLRMAASLKRGGGLDSVALGGEVDPAAVGAEHLLLLDAALRRLERLDPALCELVELHLFAGIDLKEIARLREVSEKTMHRHWRRATAFLRAQLNDEAAPPVATRTGGRSA